MKTIARKLLQRVGAAMLPSDMQDLSKARQRMATQTSAEYIDQHMATIQSVSSVFEVHDRATSAVTINDGLALEFGVFSGASINHIASKRSWTVDGFDSFEGLPESWRDGFDKGHFSRNALPQVLSNVRLHKGWFDQSLPSYLAALSNPAQPVSYLHIDCDLYSSTKTIFKFLSNNIVSGTVIVFDEYFNFPGWRQGEYLAFQEFIRDGNHRYEYLTYNSKHEQVAVIIS